LLFIGAPKKGDQYPGPRNLTRVPEKSGMLVFPLIKRKKISFFFKSGLALLLEERYRLFIPVIRWKRMPP
jgi:hypothetical protein